MLACVSLVDLDLDEACEEAADLATPEWQGTLYGADVHKVCVCWPVFCWQIWKVC